ncbi:MAG: response regulator [Nitrospirae bacterium]|nr:response regulator [Nitrospirota bacterium]
MIGTDNQEKARVLVVEDESIVAMSIQDRLKELGYTVADVVSTGEEAIKKAELLRPHLVLMDIVLKGEMDGVEAAGYIRSNLDIPVVYLSAYSDDDTLARAKVTEPYGYILKPFEQRELYINIEIALYKHRMERRLRESEQWLLGALKLMGCAVITTDVDGMVTFMNPGAAQITGWTDVEAIQEDVGNVFSIPNAHPVQKVLEEGILISKNCTLTRKDKKHVSIDFSAVAITDENRKNIGVVIAIHKAGH